METIDFDIRGQICPSTLLTALRAFNTHRERLRGKAVRLRFLTDNRDCTTTIPRAAENMGYAATVSRNEGYYLIEVENTGG